MKEPPRAGYAADTDSLALFWGDASGGGAEVAPGIVISYDQDDNVVGIEVEQAKKVFGALVRSAITAKNLSDTMRFLEQVAETDDWPETAVWVREFADAYLKKAGGSEDRQLFG